ncbi:MAG: hypothetical protein HPKKFMNG_01005 [Planctomycetes bacterium]|nr:hypothetical protein [Planctomycetota bacterium]
MPYLDVKLGTDSLLVRFVGRIDFVVGRLPKADIQLRDMSVSRLHVQFFIDSRGQAFVRDLGSSGGTLVNDTPLSNALARLHDGTRIRVGQGRIVFYDAQPPVNAVDPPGKSEPRGLIRFNARKRVILGGETVLAAEKVAAQTADGGPAEAPPVINSAEFTEDGKAIEDASVRAPGAKPPASPAAKPGAPAPTAAVKPPAPPPRKRETGIMTAPWEAKRDFNAPPANNKRPTVPLPPTAGAAALPPKPGAPAKAGRTPAPAGKSLPPAFESTPPEEDSRKTVYEPPLPADQRPSARLQPRPGALGGPKPLPAAPVPEPAKPLPPKADQTTKRRTLAEEMLEEIEAGPAMPTVKLGHEAPPARREEFPKPPPLPVPKAEEKSAVEPDLTTDEIAEYFGGERATGNLKEVKFADTDPATKQSDTTPEEVSFGPGAARLAGGADLDDELDAPAEPASAEPTTSLLGEGVTSLNESKVGEESVAQEPPVQKAPSRPAIVTPSSEELEQEHQRKLEEVKRIAREAAKAKTGPLPKDEPEALAAPARPQSKPAMKSAAYPVALPSRDSARKDTKKLMKAKKDRDTSVVKEQTIPITDNPTSKIELVPGAKTLYIPKPDVVARQEAKASSKPDLASMAKGPGGDTLAVNSREMMEELQQEYEKSQSKGSLASLQLAEQIRGQPVPVDKPAVDPNKTPPDMPVLPDQETVKKAPEAQDEEDMEFVVDDNYAFFTPPPPTRKDRKPAQDDLIDASDMLPPDKRAPEPPAKDKTVSE